MSFLKIFACLTAAFLLLPLAAAVEARKRPRRKKRPLWNT